MVVEAVRLDKIDDIESVGLVGPRVLKTEIKPLGVTLRQVVWLQYQVILVLVNLNGSSQISGLEPGFKDEGRVVA